MSKKFNEKNLDSILALLNRSLKEGISNGYYQVGMSMIKEREADSRRPKSGNVYIRKFKGGRQRKHIASRKDVEGTARLTGDKNRATNFTYDTNGMQFGVETHIEYAKKMEDTRQDTKKSFDAIEETVEDLIGDSIVKLIENNFK